MRDRAGAAAVVLAGLIAGSCSNPLARQYEYEEQLYLNVDGSATIVVDGSVPAFVALRGVALDPAPLARSDREQVRRSFESSGCRVASVGQTWRRAGRRFIQVRLEIDDVRQLSGCRPLAWSAYEFDRQPDRIVFRQRVGAAAGGSPGEVNWDGSELVAFKLHLPSRILSHNVKVLDTGANGGVERGNILTWEQHLADRRAGRPVEIEVQLEPQSILYRTLWLFAGAVAAALVTIAAVVVVVARRGRRRLAVRDPRLRP